MPDNVTSIGYFAFRDCTGLTSVTIGDGVTTLGARAFFGCSSLQRVHFTGNAPQHRFSTFSDSDTGSVYYLPNTTGWGATYAGWPIVLWNPTFVAVFRDADAVSGTVTGTPDIPIAIEASTDLRSGEWIRIHTAGLTAGSLHLHDPHAANYPVRFYRIVWP